MKRAELTGMRFGRLTVLRPNGRKYGHHAWLSRCDCGNEVTTDVRSLTSGNSSSCGCLMRDNLSARSKKHGCSAGSGKPTREYVSWAAMNARCFNVRATKYPTHGGRGITVCDRWRHSFEMFLADMGQRPPGTSLD